MARIDTNGYIERIRAGGKGSNRTPIYRNWYLVKHAQHGKTGMVSKIANIHVPAEYVGKKIRFKIEVVE